MAIDELLYKVVDQVKNFASIYLVDHTEVRDFNTMYELYDECTVMFFWRYVLHLRGFTNLQKRAGDTRVLLGWLRRVEVEWRQEGVAYWDRNKHIQVDFGTGNNNKTNFTIDKIDLIDIIEVMYREPAKEGGS